MRGNLKVRLKRVYDAPSPSDGTRLLVDRLWPRGLAKGEVRLDDWLKQLAPSDSLWRWFAHDPARWEEFKRRYFAELDGRREAWRSVLERAKRGPVTLLYAARDPEHNNAVALCLYLEQQADRRRRRRAEPGR